MSLRDDILKRLDAMPDLPSSAVQVLAMLDDPGSGVGEIVDAMRGDPTLTTEMLRLANSSYFAGPRRVGDLREAGVLFGKARLRHLVLACAVLPMARAPVRGYDLPAGKLLEHSLAVALGAEEVTRMLRREVVPHVFTAGLLHDIGKLVLGDFLGVDVCPVLQCANAASIPFDAAERAVLGIDHAEVGATLLDRWHFPETLIGAVRWHHRPESLSPADFVTDCVHVSNMVSIECGLGAGVDGLHYAPSQVVFDRLGITGDMIERLTCIMLTDLGGIRVALENGAERS